MIEIIPKLFVATAREIKEHNGKVVISLDGRFDEETESHTIWIPIIIANKARRQQMNLFAMTVHTELANNNTVYVIGSYPQTPVALAYYLHIIKKCRFNEAYAIIENKIPWVGNCLLSIEDRVFA